MTAGVKKALLTGGSGFAGSHLVAHLQSEGWEVTVFDCREPAGGGAFCKGDIQSREDVRAALQEAKPDVVFHLAGIAFVPWAEKHKDQALAVNLGGGLNLLEAVAEITPKARVLMISSSEVYGKASQEAMPLTESTPTRPANFYAFTKAALENASSYWVSAGLDVRVLRPFNHIGSGQSSLFVAAAFARQVAEAERGEIEPVLKVGNLEATRDFTDVKDMVRAYRLAGESSLEHTFYNISSEKGVRIRDLLDILLAQSKIKIEVQLDPYRLRPSDMPVMIGSHQRFSRETGWQPEIALEHSLAGILDFWRTHTNP